MVEIIPPQRSNYLCQTATQKTGRVTVSIARRILSGEEPKHMKLGLQPQLLAQRSSFQGT